MKKINIIYWLVIIVIALSFIIGFIPQSNIEISKHIVIIIVVLSVFIPIYLFFFGPMINNSKLQKKGFPGNAKVLEVRDTGVTINNNPQVNLLLEIKNSFGQVYNTECRTMVSRINPNMFQPGMIIPVKIDPDNEMNVALDISAKTTSLGMQTDANAKKKENLELELEKMKRENELLEISGIEARAIIKKYTWLGAYVNGNNPFVELEIEVIPDHIPAFSAKTNLVISEANINKFQPGSTVYIKYDPVMTNKVIVLRSA